MVDLLVLFLFLITGAATGWLGIDYLPKDFSSQSSTLEFKIPLSDDIKITHTNLNDGTIEGIECKKYNAFSVQHHPEASPGPHDSKYLFNDFIMLMQEQAKNA